MKTALLPLPLLVLLGSFCSLEAASILCLVSTAKHNNPGWSRPLFDALLAKGHQLTVLSSAPNTTPKMGLAYYHLPNEYDVMQKHFLDKNTGEYQPMVTLKQLLVWYEVFLGSCRATIESDTLKQLLPEVVAQISQEFDLIITDVTEGANCLHDLVPVWGAKPVLGLSASKLTPDLIALLRAENTISPARTPHHLSQVQKNMNFWNRMHNHIMYYGEPIINWLILRPILKKLVPTGNVFPNLQVVLLNTHTVVDYVQNLPPGVIEVGGLHIKDDVRHLPNYMVEFTQKFIDGIVYIDMPYIESIGSGIEAMVLMIKSNPNCGYIWNVNQMGFLPPDMPNLLSLHIDRSLQQDILAEAEVKGFLNHGDSFSIQEAVYFGIPMVVLPLNLEQFNNAQRVKERYLGVVVQANEFHQTSFAEALQTILDVEYFTNALYQAQLKFRSRPQTPIELAVWYAEQMIAEPTFFKDLARLEAHDQNFFVAHSLDILAVPALFVVMFLWNFTHVIYNIFKVRPKEQVPKKRKRTKKVAVIKEPENNTTLESSLEDINKEIIVEESDLPNQSPLPDEVILTEMQSELKSLITKEKSEQDKKEE